MAAAMRRTTRGTARGRAPMPRLRRACIHCLSGPSKPTMGGKGACRPTTGRKGVCRAEMRSWNGANSSEEPVHTASNKLGISSQDLEPLARSLRRRGSGLPVDVLDQIADLPFTKGVLDYQSRAADVAAWHTALSKGVVPKETAFPMEPFQSKLKETLCKLEMPRFTRRHPQLTNAVLRELITLTESFEAELREEGFDPSKQQEQRRPPPPAPSFKDSESADKPDDDADAGADQSSSGPDSEDPADSEDSSDSTSNENMPPGSGGSGEASAQQSSEGTSEEDAMAEALAARADELLGKFEERMAPVVDNLEAALEHFGNLEELLEGGTGFDLTEGQWTMQGWKEFRTLSKRLQKLRELRDLVRSLGRAGGKGPLRLAPEQLEASSFPPGVVRSQLVPEQVQGLYKSGSLTCMLPSEAALMAMGWPQPGSEEEACDEDEEGAAGSHPARLLFQARLAEKALLSYNREGWLEDEPSRVTGRLELRPAAEQGPIIVCLDTSGSMRGAREIVAKSVVLECMRAAHRQQRQCFVYAFSSKNEIQALELEQSPSGLRKILDFLSYSFHGGTDVGGPLQMALNQTQQKLWQLADILLVTDGEIPAVEDDLLQRLHAAHQDLGLEVHGLIVAPGLSREMERLCTHVHMFKSWGVVGGTKTSSW